MLPISTTYLKARKWPLLVLYIVIGAPAAWLALQKDDSYDPQQKVFIFILFALTHLLILFFWYVASQIEIQIYNDSLIYKTAFKTKEIAWRNITESELEFHFHSHGGRAQWNIVSPEKIIKIDPTYFSRKDTRMIAEVLVDKCRSAKISDNVKAMANGKFPWYVF